MPEIDEYYWYHTMDLGEGMVTDGDYDLRPHLDAYGFPDNMTGMRVLDVGRASGFFAFEFERRGAEVTCTELASSADWDMKQNRPVDPEALEWTFRRMTAGFEFARRRLNSKVLSVTASVYDLSPALFDGRRFDLVFAGSIMPHLKNPVAAFEALLSVTLGSLVIAAVCMDGDKPSMLLVNAPESWWVVTDAALTGMIEAVGASAVTVVSHIAPFNKRTRTKFHHTICHARPPVRA